MAKKKQRGNRLYRGIGRDINAASSLAHSVLDLSPLSQVDASRSNETQNVLNQLQALSDPRSASFAGGRSADMVSFMDRLQDLTKGYDSNEMNALRAERRNEMERGFAGGTAALARGQSVARTGSGQRGAQLLQLARDYGMQSSAAENDLFVKGAEEKRRAISEYGSTLQSVEAAESNRGRQALADYSSYLSDADSSQFEKQKFNAGQEAASRALDQGGTLGIMGIGESRRNARRQAKLIKAGYKSNENIAKINAQASNYAAELAKIAASYGTGGT